jgi:hypothetical protein
MNPKTSMWFEEKYCQDYSTTPVLLQFQIA